MRTCFEQLRKDAAHARRLAERASDNLARELIAIAEELEKATKTAKRKAALMRRGWEGALRCVTMG